MPLFSDPLSILKNKIKTYTIEYNQISPLQTNLKRDGICFMVALLKKFKEVDALLLFATFMYRIFREKPSIAECTTNRHLPNYSIVNLHKGLEFHCSIPDTFVVGIDVDK
jgi:hypothetical protein